MIRFRSQFSVLTLLMVITFALPAAASSHREAPLIKEDPSVDNTDVYVFRSPDQANTVTIAANYNPLEEAAGGPNYHSFADSALYEIHIDNNGDAREDITYQFRFRTEVRNPLATFLYNTGPINTLQDANLNVRQFYTVTRVTGDRRSGAATELGEFQVAPANIGPKSIPDYDALANAAVGNLPAGGKVFAGPRDDSFFVDLGAVFDLLTLRPIQQLNAVPPLKPSAPGIDALRGYNVHMIALQLPITAVTSNGQAPAQPTDPNAIIGVWATTSRPRIEIRSTGLGRLRQSLGGFTQVSRLGMPLVNEVVMPLAFKDIFNGSEPRGDLPLFEASADFRNRILDPEAPKLMKLLYNVDTPPAPRNDLVQVFLTGLPGLNMPANVVPAEMIRINLAIAPASSPNRLGALAGDLAGYPNGRRFGDDVVDITLRVAAGVLVSGFNREPNNILTDGVDDNDLPFLSSFPYAPKPHQGYDHAHHGPAAP